MLHPNQTRWLSVLPAIIRVRDEYHALKLYFNGEQLNPKNGEKSSASTIHLLLINPKKQTLSRLLKPCTSVLYGFKQRMSIRDN